MVFLLPKMISRRALTPVLLFVAAAVFVVHYNIAQEQARTEAEHRDVLDEPHHGGSSGSLGHWASPSNWKLGNILPGGGGSSVSAECPALPAVTEIPTTQASSAYDGPARHRSTIDPRPLSVPLKHTKMIKHAPGWTIYENIYMAGGTFFIVTDEMSSWPEIRMMTSTGLPADSSPENAQRREPTAKDMSFYTLKDAEKKWGDRVWEVEGVTFLVNDPGQFISHYYHFVAETWFGIWRTYASLDSNIGVKGETTLESPSRVIFAHADQNEWRDYSFFNQYFLHGAFPGIGIETKRDWEGRSQLTSQTTNQKVWRFERLLLADRSAAFRGKFPGGINQRIASEAYEGTKEESSRWWWEPVRRSILRFSGVEEKVMDLPVMWTKEWKTVSNGDVQLSEKEVQVGLAAHRRMPIVITYIVRNGQRRGMIKEDHELLVKSLTQLCDAKKWELNVVHAEKLTKEEQIALAAKTTVMLGIHGNGLTHLVWMPLTPLSTVIEIFIPGGFAKDYEWTSRALGMRHYAVWNDTYFTHPTEPRVDYPEGFQGDRIPAHGPSIAKLIEDRVEGRLP